MSRGRTDRKHRQGWAPIWKSCTPDKIGRPKVAHFNERAHLQIAERPVLLAVSSDVPLNVSFNTGHGRLCTTNLGASLPAVMRAWANLPFASLENQPAPLSSAHGRISCCCAHKLRLWSTLQRRPAQSKPWNAPRNPKNSAGSPPCRPKGPRLMARTCPAISAATNNL